MIMIILFLHARKLSKNIDIACIEIETGKSGTGDLMDPENLNIV